MNSKEPNQVTGAWRLFLRWVDRYTWRFILALVLILCSVIVVWEPSWIVSALDALRIPYAVFLVVFVMFFFLRGNYAMATAGGIALLIIIPGIWPYFKTANEMPAEKKREQRTPVQADFSVLHFNVKENNKKIASVAEAAIASGADIVSMQELKPNSFAVVDSLMRSTYPYVYSELNYIGYGMALFAKQPFIHTETLVSNNFPIIKCGLPMKEGVLWILAGTTSTPTNEKDHKIQAQQFKLMAEVVNGLQGPKLLMGDMNAVPWSEQITELINQTNLKDSRKDLSATYPAQSPLQIPIDYIFHSKEIRCKQFTTVGGTSSNHLGLMGYYTLSTESKQAKQDP